MSFTVHKDVMVAMRDGVELATDLWVPDATPAPTLLVRLPYSKDLPGLLGYGLVPNLFALVEAGYAVVYQDCRGTFRSAGDFTPMLTEADDGADTVAWVLEQPWCDGTIGTYGPSYLGFVQWASVTASDRVRAIAPCVTTTDYYTTPWYSDGGALSWHSIQSWSTQMALAEALRQLGRGTGDPQLLADLGAMLADPQPHLEALPPSHQPVLEKVWPWWSELLSHPSRDQFWQDLSVLDRARAGDGARAAHRRVVRHLRRQHRAVVHRAQVPGRHRRGPGGAAPDHRSLGPPEQHRHLPRPPVRPHGRRHHPGSDQRAPEVLRPLAARPPGGRERPPRSRSS